MKNFLKLLIVYTFFACTHTPIAKIQRGNGEVVCIEDELFSRYTNGEKVPITSIVKTSGKTEQTIWVLQRDSYGPQESGTILSIE